ncbi:hypothetical protein PACTADRAFT_46895 [Pachysolen tannophilus NRRL Y-2460]|uniref:AAA+ ATPase domain-containing protein n=1 Tax=Pachysolen tannophilus NRRL Y-2460 TaxID=669874 RepID=A0A1E4TNY1_PACTA|nr:hypothetical protein PACTADRAFT_46895 [Pachysolen tannophilus NRRL Y-2460]
MSLWVDKYRPKSLDKLDYHHDISKRLKALASSGDFPHLLVYGPSGAGKKTRILSSLRELYGPGVEKLKIDVKTFVTPTNRKLEFNVISSPYHLEITPSDMGNNDRIVIQDLLKEVAQTESVDFSNIVSNMKPTINKKNKFKVVIINEAELLTRDAQAALRRTMEKYSSNIRLILISNSTSNIIGPIRSRTLLIRVAAPTNIEILSVFNKIIEKEDLLKFLPKDEIEREKLLNNIANYNDRNLRKAILSFEALYMNNDIITISTPLIKLDWEEILKKLADSILIKRSVANIQHIRSILYDLLSHCIPARLILKTLVINLWEFCSINDKKYKIKSKDEVKLKIVNTGSIFDERLSLGSKDIFHLEGFTIKVMVILEKDSL